MLVKGIPCAHHVFTYSMTTPQEEHATNSELTTVKPHLNLSYRTINIDFNFWRAFVTIVELIVTTSEGRKPSGKWGLYVRIVSFIVDVGISCDERYIIIYVLSWRSSDALFMWVLLFCLPLLFRKSLNEHRNGTFVRTQFATSEYTLFAIYSAVITWCNITCKCIHHCSGRGRTLIKIWSH